jgi:hypothetical protein
MIYIKRITPDERAVFGTCPVCKATDGEQCTLSVQDLETWPFDDAGTGAHVARLINAPQKAAVDDGD